MKKLVNFSIILFILIQSLSSCSNFSDEVALNEMQEEPIIELQGLILKVKLKNSARDSAKKIYSLELKQEGNKLYLKADHSTFRDSVLNYKFDLSEYGFTSTKGIELYWSDPDGQNPLIMVFE